MKNILEKENSNILRGVAILSIMLHNFFHYGFRFASENEMSYSQGKADTFLRSIDSPSLNLIGDFFSFLGWVGVPVFVFLTGFGLFTKYHSHKSIETSAYLKHCYLKLFFLLLPAVLFFVVISVWKNNWVAVGKELLTLTMLQNLDYPQLSMSPEVYWYFSLTFQYYIVFLLFRKYFMPHILVLLSVMSLLFLGFLGQSDYVNTMSIYRHCLTGWFPVFALGVWCAGNNGITQISHNCILKDIILFIILFILTVAMNLNYYAWLFIPIISLMMFIYLGKIILNVPYIAKLFKWLGSNSAFIFVSHPIARATYWILLKYINLQNLYIAIIYYIVATLIIAFIYKKYYAFVKQRVVCI